MNRDMMPAAPTTIARYDGTCPSCTAPIREGNPIAQDDIGRWVHTGSCADDDGDAPEAPPTNPRCRSCWTYHAGECI